MSRWWGPSPQCPGVLLPSPPALVWLPWRRAPVLPGRGGFSVSLCRERLGGAGLSCSRSGTPCLLGVCPGVAAGCWERPWQGGRGLGATPGLPGCSRLRGPGVQACCFLPQWLEVSASEAAPGMWGRDAGRAPPQRLTRVCVVCHSGCCWGHSAPCPPLPWDTWSCGPGPYGAGRGVWPQATSGRQPDDPVRLSVLGSKRKVVRVRIGDSGRGWWRPASHDPP